MGMSIQLAAELISSLLLQSHGPSSARISAQEPGLIFLAFPLNVR